MSDVQVLLALILTPLVIVPGLGLLRHHPNRRESLSLAGGLVCVGLSWWLLKHLPRLEYGQFPLFQIMPGFTVALQVERLGALFAALVSLLWVVATLYSIGYMRAHHEKNQTRFYSFFAIAISSTLGVALSGNLLTLFIFYEILTLSTFPLVAHHQTRESFYSGKLYLVLLLGTSVILFFPAIILTYLFCGHLTFQPGGILPDTLPGYLVTLLYFIFCLGVGKAALMPFHRWLPGAMVAPAPVSALLHAVAVVKAGVFTILKITVYIFGTDQLTLHHSGMGPQVLAGLTLTVASLVALSQDNLKLRLAYSTISQLSYIVLGAALANKWGILGGSMHLVMHAFAKITLFFCAGAITVTTHKTRVSELDGLGRTMPWTMMAFFVASLSLIGLPPGGGMWSKWFLIRGALDAQEQFLAFLLVLSSLLNIAYLIPIPVRAFFKPPAEPLPAQGVHEAPILCLLPIIFTAAMTLVGFFSGDRVYRLLLPLVEGLGS